MSKPRLKVVHSRVTLDLLQRLTDLQDERLAELAPCESFTDPYLTELTVEKVRVLAQAIPQAYEVIGE